MVGSFARAGVLALAGAAALAAVATAPLAAAAKPGSIYPPDHWSFTTRISSQGQLEELIDRNIAAEKTLMVRWIASEG